MTRIPRFLKGGNFILKVKDIEVWVYAIFIFLIFSPYFIWHTKIPSILLVLCIAVSARYLRIQKDILIPALFLVLLYIFMTLRGGYNLFGLLSILLVAPLFLINGEYLAKVLRAFTIFFSIAMIPSLIVYFLVVIGGINLSNISLDALNSTKLGSYYQYPLLILYKEGGALSYRFFSYFDEPGVVGTISGVLLFLNKFNLKDKYNIPIFIAGIFSFSFFFFVILVIYIAFFANLKYKILGLVLFLIVLAFFYSNETLNELVFKRFAIKDGGLVGNNRLGPNVSSWYHKFKQTPKFLIGMGGGYHLSFGSFGASYLQVIINYGILFLIFYIGSLLTIAYRKLRLSIDLLIYVLILVGVLYQRPFIENLSYVFLIYAPIYALHRKY